MQDMNWTPENLELVSFTYNNDTVFEKESSRLTSPAYDELERVARMVGRLPQMALNVEVRFDGVSIDGKRQMLWRRRFQAIREALARKGVDASRIHTHTDAASQTLHSEITLSLITTNGCLHPVLQAQGLCHDRWSYDCRTY